MIEQSEISRQPDEKFCHSCGSAIKTVSQFCPNCGAGIGSAAGVAASAVDRAELRREGLHFTEYQAWVMVVLSIVTLGVYSLFWLNHWHGIMPNRRADDPSTSKAIWLLFIPFFNLYWMFESLLRLCTRLDEELAAAGLTDRTPRELVRWSCIVRLIPYVNILASPILGGVATGSMQSLVNRLARFDRTA